MYMDPGDTYRFIFSRNFFDDEHKTFATANPVLSDLSKERWNGVCIGSEGLVGVTDN